MCPTIAHSRATLRFCPTYRSAELLARLVKQKSSSSQIGPTQELGGIARASALLEKLLRLALKDMAEAMDTTADALETV
jgi:hypothetical protein